MTAVLAISSMGIQDESCTDTSTAESDSLLCCYQRAHMWMTKHAEPWIGVNYLRLSGTCGYRLWNVVICQGATPTSDKARRPTPTTSDRGRRWRLIGKEGSASKVLSGTYEHVAEVGTGRVALSMQRLRQGGILRMTSMTLISNR